MSDEKKTETAKQVRERVEAHCAATATAQGGYHTMLDGKVVPATRIVNADGTERYEPIVDEASKPAKATGEETSAAAAPSAATRKR